MKNIISILLGISFSIFSGCGSKSSSDTDTAISSLSNDTSEIIDSVTTSDTSSIDKYIVVDTNQEKCFNSTGVEISCTNSYQDGEYYTIAPSYTNNGDGTVTDNNTNLMWQQSADRDNNGEIKAADKLSYSEAIEYCDDLFLAGYDDWRLPNIKTIYSLMDFSGEDPSSETSNDTSGLEPFIEDNIFGFGYGDTDAGERIIDGQWATTTKYVSTTMNGDETMFGLNLADGRIKGYGISSQGEDKMFYVQCVRSNEDYGLNNFTDNNDKTITDNATNLMWHKNDNGESVDWDNAISYCESSTLDGYTDWKLPDAKELHSIVDYTRSPDTTDSPSIDIVFNSTGITNESGNSDYGSYWSSTTHKSSNGISASAVYISFGRSLGYMNNQWLDVHGAGAQRSDPKDITAINTSKYTVVDGAYTYGPQGDVVRGFNFVRCVRVIN